MTFKRCKVHNSIVLTRDAVGTLECWVCNEVHCETARVREEFREEVRQRRDYGTACQAEQDRAWGMHCATQGWDPTQHPSAKSQFTEGFVFGDAFSEGDGTVLLLRKEVERLTTEQRGCSKPYVTLPEFIDSCLQEIADDLKREGSDE